MASILVADDHPLNRQFLAALLSYHGHEVHEAADGAEALESISLSPPDLFIIDVTMPRVDGPALVAELRKDPVLSDIPVIFYTASYREEEARAIAKAAGVEYLITKPTDPGVVLETVARALGDSAPIQRHDSPEQLRSYAEQLQVTGMHMSALIELSLDLHTERDPNRLMRTACRAIRAILRSTVVTITATGDRQRTWMDGPGRAEELRRAVAPFHTQSPQRGFGSGDPLVGAVAAVVPEVSSVLLVPMMTSRRELYGWILAGRKSAWSADEERVALAAAGEVRSAHENLRLREALERREAAQRRELRRSQEDLAAVFDTSPLAIAVYDQNAIIRAWNPAAERTFGWSSEEVIGGTNPAVPPGLESELDERVREGLAGSALTYETTRLRKDGTSIEIASSLAPLHNSDGTTRGVVAIANDITQLKRTEEELRSSRERLRALSARVLSIQEEERTRISRELHDDLGQLLTAIKIEASRIVPAAARGTIVQLADLTLDTLLHIVSELRPSRIGEMGLVAAIRKKLADFEKRTGIECKLSIDLPELSVPDDVATAVFRILEEALTNIARHAHATRTDVRLRQTGGELLLEIRDNGRGIGDEELLAPDAYGLIGMRERAWFLGGSVDITGVEGGGTTVTCRFAYSLPTTTPSFARG